MMCIWSTWTQLDIDYSSNGCGRMRIEFTCCLHAGSALSHRCLYSANQDFSYSGLFYFAALHSDPYHVIHDREILSCFFPVHEVRSISDSLTFPCITSSNLATQTDNHIRKSIACFHPTMVLSRRSFFPLDSRHYRNFYRHIDGSYCSLL